MREKSTQHDFKVLVVTSFFPPAYLAGGPVRTLEALVRRSARPHRYWVMTSNSDLGAPGGLEVSTDRWEGLWGGHVWYQRHGSLRSLVRALAAELRLRPDVVYLNSLWGMRYSTLYLLLRKVGLLRAAIILAPRGQLSDAALAIKPGKKNVVLRVIRHLDLLQGVHVQASSDREVKDVRAALGPIKIVVSANETLMEAVNAEGVAATSGVPRVVYVGRISQIKGVHLLLHALAEVDDTVEVIVDVHGGALEPVYESYCRRLAASVAPGVHLTFHGTIEHRRVADVFAAADVFVLPTASENFGHVIGEALASACPVAVADTTPWTPVIEAGGGWLLPDRDPRTFASMVTRVAGMSTEERHHAKLRAASTYRSWRARQTGDGLDEVVQRLVSSRRRTSMHGRGR